MKVPFSNKRFQTCKNFYNTSTEIRKFSKLFDIPNEMDFLKLKEMQKVKIFENSRKRFSSKINFPKSKNDSLDLDRSTRNITSAQEFHYQTQSPKEDIQMIGKFISEKTTEKIGRQIQTTPSNKTSDIIKRKLKELQLRKGETHLESKNIILYDRHNGKAKGKPANIFSRKQKNKKIIYLQKVLLQGRI